MGSSTIPRTPSREQSNALFSPCNEYRYLLTRPGSSDEGEAGPTVFLMLNPSTADHLVDDPTIRRCRGFATAWGRFVSGAQSVRTSKP